MRQSEEISRQLAPGDLEAVAAMHLHPSLATQGGRHAGAEYRFYRDKIRLFQAFDPRSVLLEKDVSGRIRGMLVYTHDEPSFHRFAGPRHLRFFVHLLKTMAGYYGCHLRKYYVAARSMLGKGQASPTPAVARHGKIWALLVAEECRRQGVAGSLIAACLEDMRRRGADRLRVTVHIDNHPAIGLYEQCGFSRIGKCLESNGPAVVMEQTLGP